MVKIIMVGYLGRMGRVIAELAEKDPLCKIVAGIDAMHSQNPAPFPTYTHINQCDMEANVIIDFSAASAVNDVLDYAVKNRIPAVICTTGLSDTTLLKMNESSKEVAIFKSANMSLGVNIMANLLKRASKILYEEGFDIEIIEKHHNQKVDAPSGTALLLADVIKDTVEEPLKYTYDRTCIREKRNRNELGIHTLRGGSIVGEHSVIFAGRDEVFEIKHSAYSKEVFAVGALKAAKFLAGKPAGLYNMEHIMGTL